MLLGNYQYINSFKNSKISPALEIQSFAFIDLY